MRPSLCALAGIALCALLPLKALAAPIEVSGVRYEDSRELQGQRLVLNGAGTRYKAVFKVYTIALYLPHKADTAEAALSQPGPKHLTVTMLRDINADELGRLFMRGVEDNTPRSELSALVPGLLRMGTVFAEQKQLKAGDGFSVDWIPGQGSTVFIRGVKQGEPIKEPAFFSALMRIWLGPNPADWKVKDALLGHKD